MPYPFLSFIVLSFLFYSCEANSKAYNKSKEIIDCSKGLMERAWYVYGTEEAFPQIKDLKQGFIILVDTSVKATNFISNSEEFLREEYNTLDTSNFMFKGDEWDKLTPKQKLAKVTELRRSYKEEADSLHLANNTGKNLVRVINNTTDTVSIQMQDGSYICILQALTKSGQWMPVQYWRFSKCGNSYYNKHFPPETANSFITTLPNNGDYETSLRFKLMGTDKFYYSNEFSGRINYCEFVEDTSSFSGSRRTPQYKLDSLIYLSMY